MTTDEATKNKLHAIYERIEKYSSNPAIDFFILKILESLDESQENFPGVSKSTIFKEMPENLRSLYLFYEAIGRLEILNLISITKKKQKHIVKIAYPLGKSIVSITNKYLTGQGYY